MNLDHIDAQASVNPQALQARYIDLLTDGVSSHVLKEKGDRAVDHALMTTALSAVCIGMGEQDWLAIVMDPRRRLGQQARYAKGHPRTAVSYRTYLARVWQRATEQARPPAHRSLNRYREEAERLVARWDAVLSRLAVEAHWADAMIIAAFLDRIDDVGSPRVAFARRPLQAVTGVPERHLRTRLALLENAGVVRLEVRGKSSGPNARRRLANVYSLSGPERFFDQLHPAE